ncbi:MAG: hypothetical protein C0613_12305 [Desulfobulbaceae bacterium]|nr:MAG: hypothetical protein C0613_12305 [Desulfobulbaceae bacterium]
MKVRCFSPCEFDVGEMIYIDGGKRKGDWRVVALDEKSVTLRCPMSGKEFTWSRFCYEVGEIDRPAFIGS